jgi:methionyl-tRNA formyltransferase
VKVVFFGSPEAALPSLQRLLSAGHSVGLVVTQPDKPAGRGRKLKPCPVKAFAEERSIPVISPLKIRRDETVLGRIGGAGPDVQVVVAYGQIIPGPIIDFPPHKTLNVHFSLLPKYRGAAPVQWTVLNGDPVTGVTIIELNEKMDEGDILASVRTDVGPRETAAELESRLAEMGAGLLLDTLENIGTAVRRPQDHAQATLAPKIRKEDGLVDWTADAGSVDRKVRAFAPRPGAFTFLRGRRLEIHRGRPLECRGGETRPGEVVAADKAGLSVACGDGGVYLVEELQPEGKNRMTAFAFSLGVKSLTGDVLGSPVQG